jgi:glycosyltransferase involved in cell wall biosynthesis
VSSSGLTVDVAVIVPTFNRLDLLEETVASLQAQTLASSRFVIVDDRSDEQTRRFLKSVAGTDPRFQLIEKSTESARGCQTSRNIGLDACNADHVVFLDSDDLLSPRCLEERLSVMNANPDADIVVGRQAIMRGSHEKDRWINVPRHGVSDLDRFLQLTHPIDVPWVNGGVLIRSSSLRNAGARWRPEFHWDDIAFHFECLVAGMRVQWMGNDGAPDSHYRAHTGARYGDVLASEPGIRSAARMIGWMHNTLEAKNELTPRRHNMLVEDFFFSSVLRAIDARDMSLTRSLLDEAAASGLLTAAEHGRFARYARGRSALSFSDRATYYWNRFSEERLVPMHHPEAQSTYGTVPA